MDIAAFIERSDYFRGVSASNRKLLAEICIPKNLVKKEALFYEGDEGNAFYLLASGAVGLYKGVDNGREVVIKIIQPVEPFAEVVLFERSTYPVTAIAIKDTLLFVIPKKQFLSLLDNEHFRNDFITMLMMKQRYLAERIKFLTVHDVEERFFIFLREHFGTNLKLQLNLSKKDIAAAIGATPETYSRLITRLSKENRISITGKILTINSQVNK